MSNKSISMSDALYEYTIENWLREPEILRELREETKSLPNHNMQISPDQGQLMGVVAKLIGATSYLEVGVFTGYSSLSVALALPPDGTVVACDVSEEFTSVARRYWKKAGVDGKIDLRLAEGVVTLDALIREARQFDMAFIDADKPNYLNYYERCLRLVRQGGLILIDNVLWSGKVADVDDRQEETEVIRGVNRMLLGDERVDLALIPIADGLTVARVR
ncbi:MAG: class I SAM-dependent methyltransferase [Fimbriimonas sp.]